MTSSTNSTEMVNNPNYAIAINLVNIAVICVYIFMTIYQVRRTVRCPHGTVLHQVYAIFVTLTLFGLIANGHALYRSLYVFYFGNYVCVIPENLNLAHFSDRFSMLCRDCVLWYASIVIPTFVKKSSQEVDRLREMLKRYSE